MSIFTPTIGLEIHAQLLTATKIFCACPTRFGDAPNTNVCPVCLGLPGALPVLNRRAVQLGLRAAAALGCQIHLESIFARKNYFYPDLPKGYQISQYEQPLASAGSMTCTLDGDTHSVGIRRLHLEEDAGKLLHEGFADSDRKSYVDFNRSGVPLAEIVTQPDLRSAAAAAEFFARLRDILVYLDVNDGNMEEGSLRCDANVSVRPAGATTFGTKTEVKNLNSFRFLQRAVEFEIERQIDVLQRGGRVIQETRLWDASRQETLPMRSKEEAHDYRYFPEPDLPPLRIDTNWLDEIARALPEMPDAKRQRLVASYDLSDYEARFLTESRPLAEYFERVVTASKNAKASSNWMMGELTRLLKATGRTIDLSPVKAEALAELIQLVDRGVVSGSAAKTVFERMYESGRRAEDIVQSEGLGQVSDESALLDQVRAVISSHPDAVAQYRGGKQATFGFLVGQVMKATRGRANPTVINELLKGELGE